MEVILIAALHFTQPAAVEMTSTLNCADGQEILAGIYAHKDLSPGVQKELAETVMDHMPINCPVPIES